MSARILAVFLMVVLHMSLMPVPVTGQGGNTIVPKTWTPPRTPWGHPDLQGIWTNGNLTPLQRPADVAEKEVLTDEEWAERNAVARLSDGGPIQGPVGFYNDFWLEQGELSKRTSLIVDPPDGRLPPVAADERQRQSTRKDSSPTPIPIWLTARNSTPGRTLTPSTAALPAACQAR